MLDYPAPVMIVDDFVGRAGVEQLLQYAIAHESGFQPSKVALRHEGIIDESRRVSKVNSDVYPVMPLIDPVIRKAVDEAMPGWDLSMSSRIISSPSSRGVVTAVSSKCTPTRCRLGRAVAS